MLFLSKLLSVSVYPLGLTLLISCAGVIAALLHLRGISLACFSASILWLWVASMPAFAVWVLSTLERQSQPLPIVAVPVADVAIVIGGAIDQVHEPRTAPDLGPASNRVLYAARLFRAAKARRILVTGGQMPWRPGRQAESELIRDLLVEWGVDAAAIEIATGGRNTYENALEIREMYNRRRFGSALLITSAAHMPPALAAFDKVGLPVIPAPNDLRAVHGVSRTVLRWLPLAAALEGTTNALKEWIGLIVYRWLGRV